MINIWLYSWGLLYHW